MDFKYIDWYQEAEISLRKTHAEINELLEKFKEENYLEIKEGYTLRNLFTAKTFHFRKKGDYLYLYFCDQNWNYHFWGTNASFDSKNTNIKYGKDGLTLINKLFKTKTKKSLKTAFGETEEEFKKCCPKQLYCNFANPNQVYLASSADFTSHYPSNMMGELPDAKTAIRFEGTVEPNEEYKFAFYLKSGNVAEYKRFDTHNWKYSLLCPQLFGLKKKDNADPFIKPEDDITILMKPSKYNLNEEIQELYQQRDENPEYKNYLNAFIGMLHTKRYTSNRFAHLAAIGIARANEKMRHVAEDIIGFENILQIVVDGIIYQGTKIIGEDYKQLGILTQEFDDAAVKIAETNCYVVMKDQQVIKFKHGAYNARKDGKSIDECTSFKDMKQWIRLKSEVEEVYGKID